MDLEEEEDDEMLLMAMLLQRRHLCRERKVPRRVWVRDMFKLQKEKGASENLVQEMHTSDREVHFRFFRMSPERFDHLLSLVSPLISKEDTNFRKSISAAERLALTLTFFASGDLQISLHCLFRISRKAVSQIISETCIAIYQVLAPVYLRNPNSAEEWKKIADDFEELWHMPHVIGAMDGKHIGIEAPNKSGSLYHNYKGFFSLVLLAICDAKYQFMMVDVGQYGSTNDSAVLNESKIYKIFEERKRNIPEDEHLEGCSLDQLPYYLVGDEIFALKTWLMRPFPGKLTEEERVFNYRLSRARRVIENAFGILRARWRIFSRPIKASVENAENYTLAAVSLHNYLGQTENALYCPTGFVDSASSSGEIKLGEWRNHVDKSSCFQNFPLAKGGQRKKDANQMRESLKEYVNSVHGSVPWQLSHVRNTGKDK